MYITEKIKYKIRKQGRGWVFTPRDFLNIRHFNTINPLLDRLEQRGEIRSLGKGLYDYPVIDKETGKAKSPKLDAVIRAIEIQYGDKLQFSGEYAAFLLGLTKRLPAELKYLSNKQSRVALVAGYNIKISKTLIPSPRNKYDKATLALQALRYIGKSKVTYSLVDGVLSKLSEKELKKFKKIAKHIEWVNYLLSTR